MIVTALPLTSPLVKELVDLARMSWDPPELVEYLTARGYLAEGMTVGEDRYVISFPGVGDDSWDAAMTLQR